MIEEDCGWGLINPQGQVVAIEKDAIRAWARIAGFKPTLEACLGFHELGWRVMPASRDKARLDFLQRVGATVELMNMPIGGLMGFRVGGWRDAVNCELRRAIDIAMDLRQREDGNG